MTVAAEREYITHLFERVERIEKVADTFDENDHRRYELLDVVQDALSSCPAIRPGIAGEVLELSQPTIRAWMRQGILVEASSAHPGGSAPARRLLEPRRLHDVWHILHDLRRAGQVRGLLDAVWHSLEDRQLLQRPDLQESLSQMRRGEGAQIDPNKLRADILHESTLD